MCWNLKENSGAKELIIFWGRIFASSGQQKPIRKTRQVADSETDGQYAHNYQNLTTSYRFSVRLSLISYLASPSLLPLYSTWVCGAECREDVPLVFWYSPVNYCSNETPHALTIETWQETAVLRRHSIMIPEETAAVAMRHAVKVLLFTNRWTSQLS